MSTVEYQDEPSSRRWQHDVAVDVIAGRGVIVAEFSTSAAPVACHGRCARREVLRCRFRTTAAMRTQARDQGRHLGGRPPYGYRLVDAGPHPNQAHARWAGAYTNSTPTQ